MVKLIRTDLDFILRQIMIAEQHAAGASLASLLPNSVVPFGLRTVTGDFNNLFSGQSQFGAADTLFPRALTPSFRDDGDGDTFDKNGPAPDGLVTNTNYDSGGSAVIGAGNVLSGDVADADPRIISNLIVDQSAILDGLISTGRSNNLSAYATAYDPGPDGFLDFLGAGGNDVLKDGVQIIRGSRADGTAFETFQFLNTTPDEGLSAPFNAWFTFFGQFFDHGLDLVTKGGNGKIYVPLAVDDPLYVPGGFTNFMVVTRATQFVDVNGVRQTENTTSPFVDQNQTYSSHPSHQVFLRAYERVGDVTFATGKLIEGVHLGADGQVGGAGADADTIGGMATWAQVKAQALAMLGIRLTDADIATSVPLLATDAYGKFEPGANGYAQVVVRLADNTTILVSGTAAGLDLNDPLGDGSGTVVRTGHAFLNDIAHLAAPVIVSGALQPDLDDTVGYSGGFGTRGNNLQYDNELLDAHFIAGDGRVNENIGLTAVHAIFHSEHNRLVDHTKDVALADAQALLAGGATQAAAVAFLNNWLLVDVTSVPDTVPEIGALVWNGERLFQAAKFGTEMQYQHLVFEEFARKVQPMVDVFLAPEGFDTTINPAIVAEFAHTVYRFGHSMLTETVDRFDTNFNLVGSDPSSQIGLIQAFLNPLEFVASGNTPEQSVGNIVRGLTRTQGNEIDEFVTEALRNNLVGLPLDLAAINIARGRDTGVPTLNAARREFYAMTSDGQLKPYTSWADLSANLRHPESLMNFIAAYGTHATILAAATVADKRAAAYALVYGEAGMDGVVGNGDDTDVLFPDALVPLDRLAFLHSTGDYANLLNGVTTTGVDDIDLWIGGLAEKQMPFGGLLGSTFNFVFETQMENLQNSDRFYYLSRLAGLNLLTEMENNSFAKLIMRNSDAVHLPAEVFTTPTWTLEVNPLAQFTGLNEPGVDGVQGDDPSTSLIDEGADDVAGADGINGNSDPLGGSALVPLVIRDNPATPGLDSNYLRYTGPDHVVLGGTEGNDILIASEGDDTIWGDGGNDIIEGGDGVDNVEAGAGDDIITDKGGDDILKGNEGNDVISAGNGFNLILGGDGSDFIITGEDVSETFGGTGNDFILGAQMNLPTFGNEGDDWIEIGTSDGAGGDNFDPQEASTIIGHDVFITGGGFDEADGEGGDDIMVFSDGEDHFGGGGGFDWASYANDPLGVTADLLVNDLIEPPVTPSNQGIRDRFAEVEGLSGSKFSDVLRGDNADLTQIATADALNGELVRVGLIAGLQEFLGAGVTTFSTGNIILGGDGSDIIEGRGGDDLIDGDRSLNVRIGVYAGFDANGPTGGQIATFQTMSDPVLLANMLNGTWNPGQLQIVREILTAAGPDFDTAVYSDIFANYDIVTVGGVTTVTHRVPDGLGGFVPGAVGIDGIDRLTNIERLQFSPNPDSLIFTPEHLTGTVVLVPGLNAEPVGSLTLPSTPGTLTVSAAGVFDADNPGGTITGNPITFIWQAERDPVLAPGVFTDIVALGGAQPETAHGNTFRITADLDGLLVRARGVYQDANGVLETVYSNSIVAEAVAAPAALATPVETIVASPGNGLHLIRADLQFMLDQIVIAENHSGAYGTPSQGILDQIANSRLPFGLRTVDGTFNNLVQGQTDFGAADQDFVLQIDQIFRDDRDGDSFDANGPAPGGLVTNTDYASTISVADADPRIISNLISDQTAANLAAAIANGDAEAVWSPGMDGVFGTEGDRGDDRQVFFIPNSTPDVGLSAQFNSWFTFFGQFFDHGLDLVDKGGAGTVYIPLQADDPLIAGADGIFGNDDDLPMQQRFMAVTRATNSSVSAGLDGVPGTSDDVHLHNNETTPFVDQNQTYTSHASHQVFLREYEMRDIDPGVGVTLRTFATGRLIDGANGGIGNWAEVKLQAATMLGVQLIDTDIFDAPLLYTDAYGKFIPGPNGFAQFVLTGGGFLEANPNDNGGLGTLVPANGMRTGHAFLNDIAHNAAPGTMFDPDGPDPDGPGPIVSLPEQVVQADGDSIAGNAIGVDYRGRKVAYDDELLDAHFITGDGRGNENIGLTTVHFVFHAEHNRMVGHLKDVAAASNDASFLNNWLVTGIDQTALDGINALGPVARAAAIEALNWNGERLFQAARFSTEMQYQHLVFEEFARKVQPQVDVFLMEGQGYDSTINPAIVAEFAHVVYRFGHSMLTETIDRFDPAFNIISNPNGQDPVGQQMGLIAAFLNPLAFTQNGTISAVEGASAVIRGLTRQAGNEIDEFVTEALRNNLVGLPLDLPAINIARGRDTGVPTLNEARAEFFAMTGDSQLKPYTSWVDFAMNLKHAESLVNFIAAYGTHASITSASTTVDKRAAANLLVFGGVGEPADRLDFLYARNDYAPDGNGPKNDSLGGLNDIDLWIGGLAEKQMPFGGLLGSTFNFVFETQMEKLQNGDRFYYLERAAGLNFLTELENNSFAKLIMANTENVRHLPGDVFSTPAWTLEVDQAFQFTGLNGIGVPDGRADPTEGGSALVPLVIRDDPATPEPPELDSYLRYTGPDHVVLGGTSGNDTLIASIGDDTLYGDEGNDRLEGGDGVDIIFGGAGDDIITDRGGDDNLQGQDGNDAIHGGNGINLILGGFGNDFIITGEDESEAFGGHGNDFIFGIKPVEMIFGNEGDDWIEHGMADGSSGENFDTRGRDSIIGHDVFMGDSVADRMMGEGGDDIMLGNGGTGDRYIGASGFDWASYDHPTLSGIADLNLRAFDETPVPLGPSSVLARFESIEGLSGSAFADILRGDDLDAAGIAASGFTGSVMNAAGIALIAGMQTFLDEMIAGPTVTSSFGAGNIILGGAGSDIIEGRGGDDLIDGDASLNVQIAVYSNFEHTGAPMSRHDSMTELSAAVFAGTINPGQLGIIREIVTSPTGDFDTAVFSGPLFSNFVIGRNGNNVDIIASLPNYEIRRANGDLIDLGAPFTIAGGAIITVTHIVRDGDGTILAGVGPDGTDTLRNIERLQFADQALVINGANAAPLGSATIDDATPTENQLLTATLGNLTDADNDIDLNPTGNPGLLNPTGAITGPVAFFWQVELRGDGVFTDIINATGLGDVRVTGPTFTPGDAEVGLRLRVRVVYQDANGVIEEGYSAATAAVANVNDAPVGTVAISDTTPTETQALLAITTGITDADGLTAPGFTFQWEQANATGVGGGGTGFTPISNAQGFTPGAAQVNRELRVVTTYTDDNGTLETVISATTTVVGDSIPANAAAQVLVGNEGQDIIFGGGGADNINGNGENDFLDGGAGADLILGGSGNDTIIGGTGNDGLTGDAGNDVFSYVFGDGADGIDGGADFDTLNILGTTLADTLGVVFNGSSLTNFEGGTITGVEAVTADLLGGTDTLTYAGTTAAINVNLGAGTASGFTSILGIENVVGGSGADTLTGAAGVTNTLTGGAGNDLIVASVNDGNDIIVGGTGSDTYDLSATGAGATILTTGATTSSTSAVTGTDTLTNVENFIGSQGGDTITVNGGVNNIDGQGGDDLINAGGGADFLFGGAGNDTLIGGTGNDTVSGGADNDTIIYTFNGAANEGADTVDGGLGADTLNIVVAGAIANQSLDVIYNGTSLTRFEVSGALGTIVNVESVTANLGDGADTLTYAGTTVGVSVDLGAGMASGFTSILNIENVDGGSGSDTLVGAAGVTNTMTGEAGDDTFVVHETADIVREAAGGGTDTVNSLANTYTITDADVENLTFVGAGNFTGTGNGSSNIITAGNGTNVLNGGGGADTLIGGTGIDSLNGGAGNDTLKGGGGNDIMNGGNGNDSFVMEVGFGNDVISGFAAGTAAGQDRIDLVGMGITSTNFGAHVTIVDLGNDTLVTIDGNTITLLGVNGVGANSITVADFILAP